MGTIHLGQEIEKRLIDVGMTKAEFARRIGTTRQHVNGLLKRSSYDCDYLAKISTVLDFDFFRLLLTKPITHAQRDTRKRLYLTIELPEQAHEQVHLIGIVNEHLQ